MASQTLADGNTLTYTYNSDGIRTGKVYNDSTNSTSYTHNYLLDGTKVIRESVIITAIGGGTAYELYYVYDENGKVAGLHYDNKPYYFQKNLQGDVIRILDNAGNVVVEYTYDAWGNALSVTGSLADTVGQYNPFRYRSYYYDSETGWYYLQSRYYDPEVGRFLNADSIVAISGGLLGNNLFAYCGNSPVLLYDEFGTAWNYAAILIAKAQSKWAEMFYNSDWGAIHRAVQNDIVANRSNLTTEARINNGRADILDVATGAVWEVKPNSKTGGIDAAEASLKKYVPANINICGKTVTTFKGAAFAFFGILVASDIGENFNSLYTIIYWTPKEGVVLYEFNVARKKAPVVAEAPEEVYAADYAPARVLVGVGAVTIGHSIIKTFSYAAGKAPNSILLYGLPGSGGGGKDMMLEDLLIW